MVIKISEEKVVRIKGNRNTFSLTYIKDHLDFLTSLLIEVFEFNQKYYPYNINQYYEKESNKVIKKLTLAPYDFYNYANASPHTSRLLITKNEYDAYQLYNLLLLPENEDLAIKEKWQLQGELETRFHNVGTGGFINKKYILKDIHGGFLEAVYDETGTIVLDHLNDGTYNLYHQNALHSIDVALWLMYGVLGQDKSSMNDRVTLLKSSLNEIYHYRL